MYNWIGDLSDQMISLIQAELQTSKKIQGDHRGNEPFYDCQQCFKGKDQRPITHNSLAGVGSNLDDKDLDIIVSYSDASGVMQVSSVKARDLSSSWVWKNSISEDNGQMQGSQTQKTEDSFQPPVRYDASTKHSAEANQTGESRMLQTKMSAVDPIKLQRQILRQQRRDLRAAELIGQGKEMDDQMESAAIERSKGLDTTVKGKYSIWRRDYENPNSDATVKLMRDQIIMAKVYASIAKGKNKSGLYDSLIKHSRESLRAIGEANSDSELRKSALDQAKAMGHILSVAKEKLYDCVVLARKLRAMIQSTEENVNAEKKKSAFLIQLAAKTIPKPLHCLPQLLMANYFLQGFQNKGFANKEKLEDQSLYHYAIFSDNVLATSVVVNSTVLNANEPEKHVFHIVTDKLNFVPMKMWFLVNPPASAAVEVVNIDDFKWLNSSYCPVLRQLESARMKEYYFQVNNPSTLSAGSDNLKYRNPKYLSMLNHLRFYLPEVYPKLDKILFLDDDIVVQKDLTPLWSVDMKGMVNGAVETCKESFHRFDKYLNFSNPTISQNFDPSACGWAFGMNMFDLKEWKRRNITGIYHRWQEMNEDRTLWKLGSLPPGLITFYNLTYPMDRSWHVLGLGYDPALNQTEIENAGVIHYNGNYKPWLDLAIVKYKSYWSRYVIYDSPYLQICKITD
ncbi:Probable galacturonosyltransferase 3 [Ancistrocladus abbreviatus]